MAETQDDSAEVFDDLYLGLRAGGALRKQRRGEPLTEEEQEALGRWQRLSTWRKGIAISGFAVGTFGLGFTLGGLPHTLELTPRRRESRRKRVWNVVVAGYGQDRRPDAAEESRCLLVLLTASAVGQVAACDHELR